ncbi:ATP-binding cassette domain-containing protein [Halorubrum sp. CBA1125]|uniref:ATP-binding cassette domain-containing protein n=1 Tax=Halorubrum sp. CBA1125 TaxID=2668072 RepID=UPI0012E7AB3E|nr:ATP-binding cassette domain-containing protein [Halorubrum sp. CBA1125]MUW13976.1 ATP-binding cassette domain-containing protein [Halorubrum sp. CBA1125]
MSVQESVSEEESSGDWVLKAENVSKSFGNLQALDDVSLEINDNEVVAIVGDNGAGKSTLLYSLVGIHQIDSGRIEYATGTVLDDQNTQKVLGDEVGVVHQDMALVGIRPVFENIFMGRQIEKEYLGGLLRVSDKETMRQESRQMLDELGFEMHVDKEVRLLSGGQQQILSFARAMYTDPPIMVLDEPFTALSEEVINKLMDAIDDLKQDHSIVIVSHNLEMVREIADRIVVMRRGEKVADLSGEEIEREDILSLMVN